jgi:hypothetical protein
VTTAKIERRRSCYSFAPLRRHNRLAFSLTLASWDELPADVQFRRLPRLHFYLRTASLQLAVCLRNDRF